MRVVIYARYSSHSQTEQSIEGQLKACYEYADFNGYTVVGEYIDRAQSGTSDNRVEFQRMIADSDKHMFDAVLVYQLDRFARNRYDSAINKAKLKKNGVRVLSARENITDDASGILVEGVLESMAEYFSAELSQKIRRGMDINAQKCLSIGSSVGLGFKVDKQSREFFVDQDEAETVREIFERYASGTSVADIIRTLNNRQIRTGRGKAFNKNSLHRMLRNKRYIGTYIYKDEEVPDGMPRVIEDELFERVQLILERNKKAPARSRAKEEYLLTTKLFCGHCKEMMVGYGGTSSTGKKYKYYACKSARKKLCEKRPTQKEWIEAVVVSKCHDLLSDENIARLSREVEAACQADYDNSSIKQLKAQIKATEEAIENLWRAIEAGQSVEMLTERITQCRAEKEDYENRLAVEQSRQITYTRPQVEAFLYYLQKGDLNDENKRRAMINIFLRAVYLWDDKFTLILNGGRQPIRLEDIPLGDIKASNQEYERSNLVADAPPPD